MKSQELRGATPMDVPAGVGAMLVATRVCVGELSQNIELGMGMSISERGLSTQ